MPKTTDNFFIFETDNGELYFKPLSQEEFDKVVTVQMLYSFLNDEEKKKYEITKNMTDKEKALRREMQLSLIRSRVDTQLETVTNTVFNHLIMWMIRNGRLSISSAEFARWKDRLNLSSKTKTRKKAIEAFYKIVTTGVIPPTIVEEGVPIDVNNLQPNPVRMGFINILRSHALTGDFGVETEDVVEDV